VVGLEADREVVLFLIDPRGNPGALAIAPLVITRYVRAEEITLELLSEGAVFDLGITGAELHRVIEAGHRIDHFDFKSVLDPRGRVGGNRLAGAGRDFRGRGH